MSSLTGHGVGVTAVREVAFDDGPGLVSLDDSGVVITRTLGHSTSLGARRDVTRPHAVALLAGGGPLLAGEEDGVVAVYDRSGLARDGELRLPVGRFGAPPDVEPARRRVERAGDLDATGGSSSPVTAPGGSRCGPGRTAGCGGASGTPPRRSSA